MLGMQTITSLMDAYPLTATFAMLSLLVGIFFVLRAIADKWFDNHKPVLVVGYCANCSKPIYEGDKCIAVPWSVPDHLIKLAGVGAYLREEVAPVSYEAILYCNHDCERLSLGGWVECQ